MPQLAEPPASVAAPHPVRAIRLLVADHHPVAQHGVRLVLDGHPSLAVAAIASTGAAAVGAARRERPDIALLEPGLPDMRLVELVTRLRGCSPNTRLIGFASLVTPTVREQAVELGLSGLVSKGAAPEDLVRTITRVASGELVAPPPSDIVLREAAAKLDGAVLTDREHEILRRAARGASNSEIAADIYLAPTTVKSYLQSALAKLGARNRVEAVYKLGEVGLL